VYAQTAVAPYAVRAIEGAPIAFPVTWEDVDDDKLDAQTFTIRNVSERLDAEGISWSHIERVRDLGSARERLGELLHRSRISG
jgi:bifunctional non-homologous end joining protein LigD